MTYLRECWRDPLFRISSGAAVILLVAVIAFHFGFYANEKQASRQLGDRLRAVEREYVYQYDLSQQAEVIQATSPLLDRTIKKLSRSFSTVAFAGDLDSFVEASGVELVAQSYDDIVRQEHFSYVPVKVQIRAGYRAIREFVEAMGQGRFYTVLTKAKFERSDNDVLAELAFQVRFLKVSGDRLEK